MNKLLTCRRTYIATLAISCLTALGLSINMEVAGAISAVALGLACANAYEKKNKKDQV